MATDVLRLFRIVFVLWLAGVFVAPSSAAQLLNEEFQPLIRPEDLPAILSELSLTAEEATVFRAFYDDFFATFTNAADQAKTRIWAINQRRQEWRRENPGQPAPDSGFADAEDEWLETRRALETDFDRNVVAILPEQQFEQWDASSRRIRRQHGIAHAKTVRNIRHDTDLVDVLTGMEVENTDALRDVLADYTREMDRAVREFEFNHHSFFRRYSDLRFGPDAAHENRQEEIRESYEAWSRYPDAINNVNAAYASRIADAIESEDAASAFLSEVMRREYEAVFVPSPVERALDALRAFDDLRDEEREAIEEIADSYREAQALRREMIVRALQQWESPTAVARRQRQYEEIRENGGDPYEVERKHPALPLWEADSRAVHDTCGLIHSVFSEDRYRELPVCVQILLDW